MFRKTSVALDAEKSAVAGDQFSISIANPKSAGVILSADGSLDREYKYSRSPGRLEIEDTICVPMTQDRLSATSLNLIHTKLPHVWQRLNLLSRP
jgi:hypothetical protein